jgi:hypothetical protein
MKKLLLILALTFSSSAMADYHYYEGTEYAPWFKIVSVLIFFFGLCYGFIQSIKAQIQLGFDFFQSAICICCGAGIVWLFQNV